MRLSAYAYVHVCISFFFFSPMRMSVFWLFRVLTTQLRWVHHEFVIFAVKRLELPSDNWHLQNIQSHSTRAQAFRFGMNMCVCTCACVHVSLFRCSRGSVCAFVCILLWFWKLQSFHLLIHSFIPIILGGFFALQSKLTFLNTRITSFKNLVYKNVEAQILKKIRTS